jgi:hypothetical protein
METLSRFVVRMCIFVTEQITICLEQLPAHEKEKIKKI